MIAELQQKIKALKEENKVTILAHSYVSEAIQEIADHTADSFRLAELAQLSKNKTIIMCGVRFMAETCKVLCPQKKIILANPQSGCPMAEQFSVDEIKQIKKLLPDYTTVCYINTTAEVKTLCDVCVTSSSAVEICKKIDNDKILFLPDANLGAFVQSKVPNKTFKFLQGGCPIHANVTVKDAEEAKRLHPNALLLVHPECRPDVVALADYTGSTTGIMDFAKNYNAKEFIIGTELAIVEHLQYAYPEKKFYHLSKNLICPNMKITTLTDVYNALIGDGGEDIELPTQVKLRALKCINKMFELNDSKT